MTPAEQRQLAGIQAELGRVARYDDESVVNDKWVRQRYDCGCFASFAPARKAAVRAAWHESGHAVAALALGARFSSASIHHGCRGEGRVHGVSGASATAFVIDAAGQIGERFGDDGCAAWRYSEQVLTPLRLTIRQVARAMLVHPRHLPYAVVAALADAA